jgi:pimeloyl-ACP methyl ester carboxylesterase
MRTFEIILILVNLLALFLPLWQSSRALRLWSAGINLAALIVHGFFEGLRYQMVFSYAFVVVLLILTVTKTIRKSETKTPGCLTGVALGLSCLLLAITALLAYGLPVFRLPKPTGDLPVGILYLHLVDENRREPFLDGMPETKRELMVKVYYPAVDDRSKPFSPYFYSPQLVKAFAGFYHLPEFAFTHLNLVKTNSKEGLPISDAQPDYPVILFSHGAGSTMEVHAAQYEDLASHGYVVVAIDHPYVSAATLFPGRIALHKDATTDFDVAEPAEPITQIMADDASFVIDSLKEMNAGKVPSIFEGKLDLENIGAMGHSVGGAVAYNLAIRENRVKAAINLDGVVYTTPESDPGSVAPLLMLANDRYHIQAIETREPLLKRFEEMDEIDQKITMDIYGSRQRYQAAYDKAQKNVVGLTEVLKANGNLFTIEGSDHMKFTEIGLFIGIRPLREVLNIGGATDPARVLEITKALTLKFFDQHLKGETGNSLESLMAIYPELKPVSWP